MSRFISADVFPLSIYVKVFATTSILIGTLSVTSTSLAITIVNMNFNGVTGLENAGTGPDGVLKGGASIVGGQLVLDGTNAAEPTGAGLDLALGSLGTFSGADDFGVEFDFASIGGGTGALFSADGAKFVFDGAGSIPGGQEGSLNIYSEGDQIVADMWFIGAVEVPGTFNDNLLHHVSVFYNAEQARLEMSVDEVDGDPLVVEDGDGFLRDTTHDITRVGDENNPDFGGDFNNGCHCKFDNLLIQGPTPPPVKLIVDRVTGALSMQAIATNPVNINSISITSSAGTLDPANYREIDGNNPTFDPNDDWQVNVSSDTEISESDGPGGSNNGATLTNGQTFSLGADVWQPFFDEDLKITVFDTALGEDVRGTVEFINGSTALFGDLDLDGDIDVQDYVKFANGFDEDVDGLSTYSAYFLGDLDGNEAHNFDDFIAFAEAYDGAQGAGAFALMIRGVPEPSTWALLGCGVIGILLPRLRIRIRPVVCGAVIGANIVLLSGSNVQAATLVEYLFAANFNDTSGNNRHGLPSVGFFGGTPTVSGNKLHLTGDVQEGLIVPLGAANPFGGLNSYTIEMNFSSTGSTAFPDAGAILFGSADPVDPTEGDNQSLSIYVSPQADGGALVVDYFFVDEVRTPDVELLDGVEHSIKVTYVAPSIPGPIDDPNPGTMYLKVDNDWLATGQMAPRQPSPATNDVRIGGTLNEDFPFECEEGSCATSELQGAVDNFRVFNVAMPPSLLRANVDLSTGAVSLLGGEFNREIRYYEINSDSGSLNPSGWNSFQQQNVDSMGAGDGQHWDELAASNGQLAEAFLLGSSPFDENRTINLGNAFSIGGAQDLEFIAVTADLENIPVEISYVNAPPLISGDYNHNGIVDAADYVVWRNSDGQTGAGLPADGDGNLAVNQADYLFWRAHFGRTSGAGEAIGAAVPESSAILMVAILAGLLTPARRGVRR